MSFNVLVLGEPGTGKSSSIRNLVSEETFIINVLNKPLPFRGYRGKYIPIDTSKGLEAGGNYFATDNSENIVKLIRSINIKRPDIKNIVLDDFQYGMCNSFMRRALEKGYQKFSEIGKEAWEILMELPYLRSDMYCFVLTHSEIKDNGLTGCKTIGKMLEDKFSVEGMFITALHSKVMDGKYLFLTQTDGIHVARSPMEMFDEKYIPNDLAYVKSVMEEYYRDVDIEMQPPQGEN